MSTAIVIVVVVAAVVVAGAVAFAVWQVAERKKTEELQNQYGSEYDRAVSQHGKDAKTVLEDRKKKVESYDIRPLSTEDRERYTQQWQSVQAGFVDDPGQAIEQADGLIRDAMVKRGYPAGSFEQSEEAASVKYPDVVDNFRQAHQIAEAQKQGRASTEDIRQGVVLYRSLFEKVVGPSPREAVGSRQ